MAAAADRAYSPSTLATFAESFEATCLRQADHPAVVVDGESRTYGELNLAARSFAANLLRLVPTGERPVALQLPKGPALLAAIVGAVLARRCFVVLDLDYPAERNNQVLEDADPALVIVSGGVSETSSKSHICIDVRELLNNSAEPAFESAVGDPDDLAVLVYTSGSTGRPKAAMMTHGAIAQMGYIQTMRIGVAGNDRHAMLHSATTVGALRTMFGALFAGATIFPYELAKLGVRPLADWLERNRISIIHTTPTVIRRLVLVQEQPRKLQDMRLMIFGAERVLWEDVGLARSIFSETLEAWSGLGASEAGTLSGWLIPASLHLGDGLVPIGNAVDGVTLRLVDEQGVDVQEGETGELEARGHYISLGYWRRPDLTVKAFSQSPSGGRVYRTGDLARRLSNGMFLHSGRRDFVTKINGVRVDMGEVEAAIVRDPDIAECAVVCEVVSPTESRLHAFVEAVPGAQITEAGLRESAARALLPSMRPTYYWQVGSWPRLPNGKMNRRALLEWADRWPVSDDGAGRDDGRVLDIEPAISAAWEKVMPGRPPGRHEDFFGSGGTSLMAIELIREIRARLNRHIPGELLFRAPTVADLARALQEGQDATGRDSVVPLQSAGEAVPLYCICGIQLYAELARHLAPDIPVHGVFVPWEERIIDAAINDDTKDWLTVEDMAASYVHEIRRHQSRGPYAVLGISFGGVLAYEVARQLTEAGQEVRLLALLDCLRPGDHVIPWYRKPRLFLRRLCFRRPPRLPPGTSPEPVGTEQEKTLGAARMATYRRARAKYVALPWTGRAVLFRARHTIRYRHLAPERAYGWDSVIPDLLSVDVPGDHLGILRDGGAVEIARVLRAMTIPRRP